MFVTVSLWLCFVRCLGYDLCGVVIYFVGFGILFVVTGYLVAVGCGFNEIGGSILDLVTRRGWVLRCILWDVRFVDFVFPLGFGLLVKL